MKQITKLCLVLLCKTILLSCGSGSNNDTVIKSKDGKVTVSDLQKASEQMKDAMDIAEKRKQERRERGDTLAMHYKDLQQYLPEVSGYEKKGNPGGESVSGAGFGSFSKAEQRYQSGDKRLEIELIDYNQSAYGFTAAIGMVGMNVQIENDREKTGSFNTGMEGVKGYERVFKTENRAEVTYAVVDRFLITIKARGSNNGEELKSIAKSMKLSELASK